MLVLAVVMMMTTAGACRRSDPPSPTGSDTTEPVAATSPPVAIRYAVLANGRSTEFAASQPAMSAVVSCRDDAARTELVGKLGLSRTERDSVLLRRDDAIVVVFGPQVRAGGGMHLTDARRLGAALELTVEVKPPATGGPGLPASGRGVLVLAMEPGAACSSNHDPLAVTVR